MKTTSSAVLALTAAAALLAAWSPPVDALPPEPTVVVTGLNNSRHFLLGRRLQSAGLAGTAQEYAAFWGVPFAKAPVGELRFKAPVPAPLPPGFSSFDSPDVPPCLQQDRNTSKIVGAEDCLKLHIFTPNYDKPELPVIVMYHGGGYMYGRAPVLGTQFIMDHPVVLVTVEYRLGILGFMSFEDSEAPGNLGLLDMLEALRWVHANIRHFGGDSNRITVAGFSAGSAAAHVLSMSKQTKGMIKGVIGMSGSPLNPWALQQSPRQNALEVARLMNCSAATTAAAVACLRGKDAGELAALQGAHFQDWLKNPFSPFGPVVDGRWSKSPVLADDPRKILGSKSSAADVPALLSLTADEGLFPTAEFLADPAKVQKLDQQWETDAPRLLHLHGDHPSAERREGVARRIRDQYLPLNASLAQEWRRLVKMVSDQNFVVGIAEQARMQAASQTRPVFVYLFDYRGEHSLAATDTGDRTTDWGVGHADDFQYLFDFSWSGPMTRPVDVQMRKQLVELWATFARNATAVFGNATWTPVPRTGDAEVFEYLLIASPTNATMARERDAGRGSFWKTLNHSGRASASLSLSVASLAFLALMSLAKSS